MPTDGIAGEEFEGDDKNPSGRAAFFTLEGGLIFALYPDLAKAANRLRGNGIEFSMGYLVNEDSEVGMIIDRPKKAGATVTEEPRKRPWGDLFWVLSGPGRPFLGDHLQPGITV